MLLVLVPHLTVGSIISTFDLWSVIGPAVVPHTLPSFLTFNISPLLFKFTAGFSRAPILTSGGGESESHQLSWGEAKCLNPSFISCRCKKSPSGNTAVGTRRLPRGWISWPVSQATQKMQNKLMPEEDDKVTLAFGPSVVWHGLWNRTLP